MEASIHAQSRGAVRSHGFTLIELLVVISIIAILAGLLIPTITMVQKLAGQTDDGNDLRQIATTAIAYMTDHDGQWPAIYAAADGSVTDRAGADPRASAIASLELLVFETGRQLPNQVFQSRGLPVHMPRDLASDIRTTGSSAWAAAAALDDSNVPAYAYDWSVPASATSQRVVLAHRGHGIWDGTIVAVYADGHSQKLSARIGSPSAGGSYQLDDLKQPGSKAWETRNPLSMDDPQDNVFDDADDDGTHTAIGRGSSLRAALK